MEISNYFNATKDNEKIFIAILRELSANKNSGRQGASIVPELELNLNLHEIFRKYSTGDRNSKFTILNFFMEGDKAIISFEKMNNSRRGGGSGAMLRYTIISNSEIKYETCLMDWQLKL